MVSVVLYHGSSQELVGETLNPSQGDDSDERPENKLFAVYATDHRTWAIIMAIFSCEGVMGGSIEGFDGETVDATLYGEPPNQKYVYLYTLPSETFRATKSIEHQFISEVPVKPLQVEKILVSDYIHLLKRATKEETEKWLEKYGKMP